MKKRFVIAEVGSIPENEGIVSHIDGRPIAVFFKDGKYYAIDGTCPHAGAMLGQGELEEDHVVCPWHEWKVNIKTGESDEIPGYFLDTFDVVVDGNDIVIEVETP